MCALLLYKRSVEYVSGDELDGEIFMTMLVFILRARSLESSRVQSNRPIDAGRDAGDYASVSPIQQALFR